MAQVAQGDRKIAGVTGQKYPIRLRLAVMALAVVLAVACDQGSSGAGKTAPSDAVPVGQIQAWLEDGPWMCVDATSRGSVSGAGIMKGATFTFTGGRLVLTGGGARAEHDYRVVSAHKSVSGGEAFATLQIGEHSESLLKMSPENGVDCAGLGWGGDQWTLKLVRSR